MGKWLSKVFSGELGWKTVTSAVILMVLAILRGSNHISPDQFDTAAKAAEGLGFIGLRDALSKLKA